MVLIVLLGVVGIFVNVVFEPGMYGGFTVVNDSESWSNLLDNIQQDIYTYKVVQLSGILLISITVPSFYLIGNGFIRKLSKR